MEIPQMSRELRATLAEELAKGPTDKTAEEATFLAMKAIAARIQAGEAHLFDPTNAGDNLALAFGCMD